VEDNADARETLQELFSAQGHEVIAAGSFAEAVELALQVRPEAILCDLHLPDRDGTAVASSLRPLLPKAVFIAMSGDLSPEVSERARAAGFDDCLQKPLAPEGLQRALHAA
jgi:CheY-like chemotaxis protein